MRAMISIDSGDTAEANVRPRKLARGAGRISTRGCWYSSPSYSMTPVSRASRMAALYSVKRRRDSPMAHPEAHELLLAQAAADAEHRSAT